MTTSNYNVHDHKIDSVLKPKNNSNLYNSFTLIFNKYSGITFIVIASLIPFFLWFPSVRNQFSLRSIGQILALTGTILFSINFILSGRFKILEKFFNGINQVYIVHHIIGELALILLLFHPIFIALFYTKISLESAFDIVFPPLSDYATWLGSGALITLMAFLILTLYIKLPYDIWKFTHKFLGLSIFLASLHIFFINSSVTTNLPLRFYVLGFCTLGLFSYTYRTILGKYLVKRYKYKISKLNILGDITEVTLSPIGKKIEYIPGQFVFIKFISSLGVTTEEHPFSLTSSPKDNQISISAKSVGNYTETLKLLKPESEAIIEGPFGAFSFITKPRKKQVWIAGGIGITPFLSMARSLSAVNDYQIFLYYVVSLQEEAVYLDLLKQIAANHSNFILVPVFTKIEGRLSAETVNKQVADLVKNDIFVCGPPPMMKSLRAQFNKLGIRNSHIFSEEFSID